MYTTIAHTHTYKRTRSLLVSCCMLITVICYSQDIHFSQYFSSPLILNPALTGQFEGDFRFTTNYKKQWTAISKNDFKTFASSIDAAVYEKKVFAGLSFYNDKAGDAMMKTNTVNFSLASKIIIDDANTLVGGIQLGWAQRSVDISAATWDNQYDGKNFNTSLPSGETIYPSTINYFDLSSGLYWQCTLNKKVKLDAGIGAFHLNRPRQSFYSENDRLHAKWTFHGSSEIKPDKNKNITYIPSLMILKQGAANEINIGMMAKYNLGMDSKYTGINISSNAVFGIFYRVKDAAILYFGYEYKNRSSIGFSYDINVSKLRTASTYRGGAELFLSYKMFRPKKAISVLNRVTE
jgi:type IX secretion system PorP/SprF family membrane protein